MNAITRYASHSMATEGYSTQIQILALMCKKRGVLCFLPVFYVTATYERKHRIHPYQLQPQPSGYISPYEDNGDSFCSKVYFLHVTCFWCIFMYRLRLHVFVLENMWKTRCVMLCKDIDPHRPACPRPVLAPVSSLLRSYWSACHCWLLIGRGFSRQEKLRRK